MESDENETVGLEGVKGLRPNLPCFVSSTNLCTVERNKSRNAILSPESIGNSRGIFITSNNRSSGRVESRPVGRKRAPLMGHVGARVRVAPLLLVNSSRDREHARGLLLPLLPLPPLAILARNRGKRKRA